MPAAAMEAAVPQFCGLLGTVVAHLITGEDVKRARWEVTTLLEATRVINKDFIMKSKVHLLVTR